MHINFGSTAAFAIHGGKRIAASLQNTAADMLLLVAYQHAVLRSPLAVFFDFLTQSNYRYRPAS